MKKTAKLLLIVALISLALLTASSCRNTLFEVSFMVDGELYYTIGTVGEEVIQLPKNPTKEDLAFDGWYWDEGTWKKPFTAASLLDVPLSENMCVYARFVSVEEIQGTAVKLEGFEALEDGTLHISVSNTTSVFSLNEVVKVDPKSTWFLSSNMAGTDVIPSNTVELLTGDNDFYLIVESETGYKKLYNIEIRRRPKYTVTFDSTGGNSIAEMRVEEDSLLEVPQPKREGYTFSKWSYDFSKPIKRNINAVAEWLPNNYEIYYDANGGTMRQTTQLVAYDSEIILLTPERYDYTFTGWLLDGKEFTETIWKKTEGITLKASWIPTPYSISYDLAGGSETVSNQGVYTVESDEIALTAPTREGYTFAGWTGTDLQIPTKEVTIPTGSKGNRSYTATWEANDYRVTLDADGGTCQYSMIVLTYDENYRLPNPVKVGYTFDGWYTEDSVQYELGVWNVAKDLTLKAKWVANEYKLTLEDVVSKVDVTFDYNTTGVENRVVSIGSGQTLARPAEPTRSGYVFRGWFTDSACTTLYSFSGDITEDMTLYAGWQAMATSYNYRYEIDPTEYTSSSDYYSSLSAYGTSSGYKNYLYFVANESGTHYFYYRNSSSSSYSTYIMIKNLTQDTTIKSNNYCSSTSFTYVSASCNPGDVIEISFYRYSTSSINYYGTPYFYFSGFSDENVSSAIGKSIKYEYTEDAKVEINCEYDASFTLPELGREGYTFLGWYNGNTKVESGAWKIASNVTLAPRWQANSYTVTLDANGGTCSSTGFNVNYDASYTLPTPVREGYTFDGWYNGSTKYSGGTWTTASNVTLTAKWKANDYEIILDNTKKSFATATITYNYNYAGKESTVVTLNNGDTLSYPEIPTRTGYAFAGWYANSSCAGTPFDFSADVTEDITLFAKWVEMQTTTHTREYFNVINYSTSSSKKTVIASSYSDNNYYYFTCLTSGEYTIYEQWVEGDFYFEIYNATEGYTIDTANLYSNYLSNVVTFTASAGDVICISTRRYSSDYNYTSSGTFYVTGASYPADGGEVNTGEADEWLYESGEEEKLTVTFDEYVTIPTPVREGYTFLGWYNGSTKIESGEWKYSYNVKLIPKWQVNTYTVTLNANGGTCSILGFNVNYGDSYTLPTPVRVGYTFGGWYNGATKYESGKWASTSSITLTAKWNIVNYTISYNLNGGTNSGSNKTSYTVEDSFSVYSPSKTGYTFLGWTYEGQTTPVLSVQISNTTGNKSYTANWQANTYTVTLNSNGGTCSSSGFSATYNSSYTLPTPTRVGYTFSGWYNGSTKYSGGTWITASNVTLTAKWTVNTYDVTFEDLKDGVNVTFDYNYSGKTDSVVKLYSKDTLARPAEPTRSGYVFRGWFTDSACTTLYSFSGDITEDMTLYAGWQAMATSYNYRYEIDPAEYTSSSDYYSSLSAYGTSSSYKNYLYFVANESGTHYFYYRNSSSSSSYYTYIMIKNLTQGTTIKSNSYCSSTSFTSVSASCNPGDVIEISFYRYSTSSSSYYGTPYFYFKGFSSTSQSTAVVDAKYAEGVNTERELTYGVSYTLPTPVRVGYTFLGWYNGNTKVESGAWKIASNVTLTPKWQANSYTVTLDANGGTCSYSSVTATYDSSYTLPTPTRAGYTFGGWYNGTTKYNGGTWKTTSNTTLTAKWSVITYSIGYTLNGGTNSGSNKTSYTVETAITLYAPTKTGYTFIGWTYEGQTKPVMSVTISKGTIGNKAYTANWQANTYTVTLDANGGTCSSSGFTATYDSSYTLPTPTRVGYTFDGWYNGSTKYSGGTWTTTSNVTLTAKWIARDDISYVVNHYKEKLDGNYELVGTENLVGTAGASISPAVNTYDCFTSPSIQNVTVSPDGSLVVDYYYTRNSYTITFVENGGSETTDITQKYESALTVPDGTREGYTFGGWFTDKNLSNEFTDTTMPGQDVTVYAWWTEENKPSDFTYSGSTSIEISGYSGNSSTLWIPEYIGGVAVESIKSNAFANNTAIETVRIPQTIKRLESGVFAGCTSIKEMFVNSNAFIEHADALYSVTQQTSFSVSGTTLTSTNTAQSSTSYYTIKANYNFTVTFNYSVSSEATHDKLIVSVNGEELFRASGDQSGSKTISLNANDTLTFSYSKDASVNKGSDRATITNLSFEYEGQIIAMLFGTAQAEGTTPVVINELTYYAPNTLTKITIEGKVVSESVLQGLSMVEEVVLIGAETIRANAFRSCSSLVSIEGVEHLTYIGNNAFRDCVKLERFGSCETGELILSSGLTSIGAQAFLNDANFTKVYIPETVTYIGSGAFGGLNALTEITLPFVGIRESETTVRWTTLGYIFGDGDCSDNSMSYSSTIYKTSETSDYTSQGLYSDSNYFYFVIPKTLKKVTITKQTAIPADAFRNCDLIEEINIPMGVTSIGNNAFDGCSSLKRLNGTDDGVFNIPDTVTSIGDSAFKGCSSLVEITLPFTGKDMSTTNVYEQVFGYIFGYSTSSSTGTTNSYSNYYYYIPSTIRKVTITTDETIPSYAFRNCSFIQEINIPTSATSVGNSAFSGCTGLKRLNSTVDGVFNIPTGVTAIGEYAFSGCAGIEKVNSNTVGEMILPSNLTTIGNYAFQGLSKITKIVVPETVTSIGDSAFKSCSSLVDITLPFTGKDMSTTTGSEQVFGYIFGWSTSSTTGTTNSYSSNYYYIPGTIRKVTITTDKTIPSYAFRNCSFIQEINIPENATSIGSYAFDGCTGLKRLNSTVDGVFNIPTGVTNINQYSFYNCKLLTSFTCGNITSIGNYAFYGCASLTGLTLPSTVASIGEYAFSGCAGIEKVNSDTAGEMILPSNLTTIGSFAFQGLSKITKIVVPDTVTSIGKGAFKGCSSLVDITLPFTGKDMSTTTVSEQVFGYIFGWSTSSTTGTTNSYSSNYYYIPQTIRKVTITKDTEIPAYAFKNCSFIQEISIPTGTTSIGSYAFDGCTGLKRLNSTVDGVFNIPTGVTTINQYSFYNCKLLTSFTCGNITSIGNYAFYGCGSLNTFDLKNSLTSIGNYAFYNCASIDTLVLPDTVKTIGEYAFSGCAGIEKVNSNTVGEMILPSNLTTIGNYAFQGLSKITKIVVPDTVTSIGDSAFKGCSSLVDITLPFTGKDMSTTTVSEQVFGYIFGYQTTTATGTTNNYGSYYYYIPQTIRKVTITTDETIPSYAFRNCSFIQEINIPENATSIGSYAFDGCTDLKRLNSTEDGVFNIPTGVTTINQYAFRSCKAVIKVNLSPETTAINTYAFNGCSALEETKFGKELKTIGAYAFENCTSLSRVNSQTDGEIVIPFGIKTIGDYAFRYATAVTKIVVSESVTSIGNGVFRGCSSLVDITIPFIGKSPNSTSNSEKMFGYIFGYYNTSSSVSGTITQYSTSYKYYVPKTIRTVTITVATSIADYGFQNCSFITTINLPKGATAGTNTFSNCGATVNYTVEPVAAPAWNGTTATGFNGGTGTQNDPYVIFSGNQLKYLANQVNSGVSYENTYFVISANIYLDNRSFTVIGSSETTPFKGVIDGQNHIITDFTITSSEYYVGLFGYNEGTIKNLGIENATISATKTDSGPVYIGGLCAYSKGVIEGCYTTATVTSSCGYTVYGGGLVGYNEGTIKECYASGNVTSKSTNLIAYAGGIAGGNSGTIESCVSYGSKTATGYSADISYRAGITAENSGEVTSCYYNRSSTDYVNSLGTKASLTEINEYCAENWDNEKWDFSTNIPHFN